MLIEATHHASAEKSGILQGTRVIGCVILCLPVRGHWKLGKLRLAVDRIANSQPETVKRGSRVTFTYCNGWLA
jgi:hypothetical protein